jgi:hypothetical protein
VPRSTRSIAALATLALAGFLTAAATSSGAIQSNAAAASFCSASKGVAAHIAGLASSLKSTSTLAQRQATLKTELTTIKRAGPSLKSTAPKTLKPKVTIVLGFVSLAYSKLSAVGWSFATLASQPTTLAALEAASARADPAMNTLDTYYRRVCKFKV